MLRQVVFDLETTGLMFAEGHRIVEIGAVELDDGRPTGRTFHRYVNPGRDVPEDATRVHGLTTQFLADKPPFSDPAVAAAFLEFVEGTVLIAHNGLNFDIPFLNAELAHHGFRTLSNEAIDTLLLARKVFPGSPASLDALCSRFGISTEIRERDGHGALLDSTLLARVYLGLTGGAQRGLNLVTQDDSSKGLGQAARSLVPLIRRRPVLLTEAEREAHARFIDQIGKDALWMKWAVGQ